MKKLRKRKIRVYYKKASRFKLRPGHESFLKTNKIKEIIKKMGFDPDTVKLIFSNKEKITPLDTWKQDNKYNKPDGRWYACGTEWLEFINFSGMDYMMKRYLHIIDKLPDNMYIIKTEEELEAFEKEYFQNKDFDRVNKPDWERLGREYDGIEICPWQGGNYWHRTWDIGSGAIWNMGGLKVHDSPIDLKERRLTIGKNYFQDKIEDKDKNEDMELDDEKT